MDLLQAIKAAWSWRGLDPVEVIELSAFGNVIVRSVADDYWRICPEELSAKKIADTAAEFGRLRSEHPFEQDWNMTALVEKARAKFGPLEMGRCYCLKIPGVLGGTYDTENLGTIGIEELISVAGDMAHQIDEVLEGTTVKLVIGKPVNR